MATWRSPGRRQHPHHLVEARRGDRADRGVDLGTETAGADEHEALGALGVLVAELHRHSPAEAVPDDGRGVDAQHGQQVAHAVGVAADAVVGPRLVGRPVPEQVGRDDGVRPGERVDDRPPGRVVAAEAVEQEDDGPRSGADVGASVPVHGHVLDLRAAATGHSTFHLDLRGANCSGFNQSGAARYPTRLAHDAKS